jgi:Family of unknown function (DUF6283)
VADEAELMTVRRTPCASCPFRRDVPSGIWSRYEYGKLPAYDGTMAEQVAQGGDIPFGCHQGAGNELCAGWAGFRDPHDLIALRLGVTAGRMDPAVLSYSTDVPLFASGAEAAEHGERDIEDPSPEARSAVAKVVKVRKVRGKPVNFT